MKVISRRALARTSVLFASDWDIDNLPCAICAPTVSLMTQSHGENADPLWYRDAVIYELHVKTFCDSDGDGMGDFRGLIEKLDYLQELGVTAIWLLPFYPSPMRDDGYDIADYFDVNPNFGTLDDFRAFLDAAHERNLRVITELVINHTSDQNPWFQKSRRAIAIAGLVPVGDYSGSKSASGVTDAGYSDEDLAYRDFYV